MTNSEKAEIVIRVESSHRVVKLPRESYHEESQSPVTEYYSLDRFYSFESVALRERWISIISTKRLVKVSSVRFSKVEKRRKLSMLQ